MALSSGFMRERAGRTIVAGKQTIKKGPKPLWLRSSHSGGQAPEGQELQYVDRVQFFECQFQTSHHGCLSRTQPYTWVIEFLVRFVRAFRVTQLTLQVGFVFLVELQNTVPVCPLGVGIDVHFDNTVTYRFFDFCCSRTRTTVEHEVQRVVCKVMFLANVFLRITQDRWSQFNVTWFVHAVYVTE